MKLHWLLALTIVALVAPLTSLCQDGTTKIIPKPVYRVGGAVTAPRAIYAPEPTYDDASRKAKIEGTVKLVIIVAADGSVRASKVVKGLSEGLDKQAIDAVSQWKFDPGTKDGKPVAVQTDVECTFTFK
jgi:protein TonB